MTNRNPAPLQIVSMVPIAVTRIPTIGLANSDLELGYGNVSLSKHRQFESVKDGLPLSLALYRTVMQTFSP